MRSPTKLFRFDLMASMASMAPMALISLAIVMTSSAVLAEEGTSSVSSRKGRVYMSWGYNRSTYTPSNIHFTGPNYNFTLHSVSATDRPTDFSFSRYFDPTKATIPQYEFRVSYFISERTSVSFGISHFKYVVTQNQGTNISGFIDPSLSASLGGSHDFDPVEITSGFLRFEHTNGLNYESVEVETLFPLLQNLNHTRGLYVTTAAGVGVIIPKSDVTLFNERTKNVLQLAGYGTNGKLGLRFEFLDRFFIKAFTNFGYLKLPKILTRSGETGDRASQSFYFIEGSFIAGLSLYTFK